MSGDKTHFVQYGLHFWGLYGLRHILPKKLFGIIPISLIIKGMLLWLSLLHNFIQQSLNSGSTQIQILLAACGRFKMVKISDSGPTWK